MDLDYLNEIDTDRKESDSKEPGRNGDGRKSAPDKRGGRRKKPLITICNLLAFAVIALAVLAVAAFAGKKKSDERAAKAEAELTALQEEYAGLDVDSLVYDARQEGVEEGRQAVKEAIRIELTEKGSSINDVIRKLYPEYLIFMSGGGYHFVPVDESIPRNNYSHNDFAVSDNGMMEYVGDSDVKVAHVIDVSKHQGVVDWQAVADAGVEYAMIRVGFRGYGSGALVTDDYFEDNIRGALKAGIKVGVYFYTQAIDADEGREEAEFVIDAISPYKIELPVAIDVERPDDSTARGNQITREVRTEAVKTFCECIEEAGYEPMIYGGTNTFAEMLDIKEVYMYPVWYAFYNNYMYYPYPVRMWQYSTDGAVPGIKVNVDMNVWMIEPEENTDSTAGG